MSRHSDRDRVIALAGMFQGASLVRELARRGQCDSQAMTASLDSLFVFDAPGVAEVFGGVSGIRAGLNTLVSQLDKPGERDLEVARYAIAAIHHGDKLNRDQARLERLSEALTALRNRSTDFDLSDNSRSLQLGRLYQDMVSDIHPPIMIRGEPLYLQNSDVAARVRACLLAAIRAAILWRQCNGHKLQLLFGRRRIAALAHSLLGDALHSPGADA